MIKQAILEVIKDKKKGVSFVELENSIEGFRGDKTFWLEGNIVIWSSISREAAEAIQQLLNEKAIHFNETSYLTYLIDGTMIQLPLVKRPPAHPYKKPHWLPVAFSYGPREK